MPPAPRSPVGPHFTRLLRASVYRPLVTLLLLAGLFVGQVAYLISLTNWVEHTDQVISQSNELLKHFGYATTGFRSYAVLKDRRDLQEYRASMPLVMRDMSRLRELVSDNRDQLRDATEIQASIRRWEAGIEALILRMGSTPPLRPGGNSQDLEDLRNLRNDIRVKLEHFISIEEQFRIHRVDAESAATVLMLILTLLLSLALGAYLASTARRQLRELSETYENAIRTRDDFLAIASHELKTPITSLQLQLQVVKARFEHLPTHTPDILSFQRSINLFARQTQRLTLLIESILNVSQIQSSSFRMEPDEFELAPFLRSIGQAQGAEFEQVGSTLSVSAPEGILVVWDRRRMEQALTNILSNAVKYAPGTPVEINAQAAQERVRIDIVDRGPGLTEKIQDRIFERFARGHDYEKVSGMGLGLYLAREIALAHDGRISVAPVFPGPGTCFSLELPRVISPGGDSRLEPPGNSISA